MKEGAVPTSSSVPRTFVMERGKIGTTLNQLVLDLRQVMEPYTASRLKVGGALHNKCHFPFYPLTLPFFLGSSAKCSEGFCSGSRSSWCHPLCHHLTHGEFHQSPSVSATSWTHPNLSYQISEGGREGGYMTTKRTLTSWPIKLRKTYLVSKIRKFLIVVW